MAQKKYCPECDHLNLSTSKFCSECGYDLSLDSKSLISKNCKDCGRENSKEALFCSNCGTAFNNLRQQGQVKRKINKSLSNKPNRKKVSRKSFLSKYSFLFVAGGLLLIFTFIYNNEKEAPVQEYSPVQPVSQDFALERKVMEAAFKFTCSCGSCDEEALETCTCNIAEQERNFIRQELESGKSVSQAVLAVNTKFGHLKPEFVNNIEDGGLNLNLPARGQNDIFSRLSGSSSNNSNRIASSEDREEIFSHFECPCGQCGLPELAECSCTHPKGATEVKLFVDNQIENENSTVNDLIEMVEKKYGHKIR